MSDEQDEAAAMIMKLIAARGDGKTICPSEATRALDADAWREAMPRVHAAAAELAAAGKVVLTQRGVAKTSGDIVGAYRIGGFPRPVRIGLTPDPATPDLLTPAPAMPRFPRPANRCP